MERALLIAANFLAYLLFIYKCFSLIEGMLDGKHYGLPMRMLLGVINAVMMVAMALNISITTAYLITLPALYAELTILFRKPFKETLFVSVVVMMNIMCFRGIVLSIFALTSGGTLYYIYSSPNLYLSALLVSNLLECLAVYLILRFIHIENLIFTMTNKTQSRYIIIWASLCVLFMFRSSEVYVRDYNIPNMFFDHFFYCFILLLSFYFFLNYTFQLNKAARLRERLSRQLGNQMVLQSALTQEAIYTSKANLTQNLVISGAEIYGDALEQLNNKYDKWFDYVKTRLHPDDMDICLKSLDRQKLLENFKHGVEPKPFEYRHMGTDNNFHWVKLVLRMFQDIKSDDVFLFGYAFDIENEKSEKEALLFIAQTDIFTGLYNKSTTEILIDEEIRNGAGILIALDIDDFKSVNDKFGHEAGDFILKYFAELLTSVFSEGELVGRIGGDEFMVFIKNTTDLELAKRKATQLHEQLKTGVDYKSLHINITTSMGIAVVDEKIDSFSVAYNQADIALYRAKNSGKHRHEVYRQPS